MIRGITYYKLNSDYEGAIPAKNCGLTGEEIDNNFYVLEGRDIKGVTVEGNRIIITLVNGDTISSDDVFSNFAKDLTFDFDSETGTLYITQNGQTTEISGFSMSEDCCFKGVYTDETITGKGTIDSPLSISPSFKPGLYEPVIGIIDKTNGTDIFPPENLYVGARYLIKDYANEYGMLYCYKGVGEICKKLCDSEWKIPSKEDWDNMLNAIEPLEQYRNHDDKRSNQWLGKYAGKYLKSLHTSDFDYWKYEEPATDDEPEDPCANCCHRNDPCRPVYCGECGKCCEQGEKITPEGIDSYGFNVIPAGFGDNLAGDIVCGGFGKLASFWTSDMTRDGAVAYIKTFTWDRTEVQQDIVPTSQYHSLRLVKEYNGHNFYGREEILGQEYETVIMPSADGKRMVWTASNICVSGDEYCSLRPNCGSDEELPQTVIYYILEWDGENWISTSLGEGFSVTVVVDGKPTDYHIVINQETGDAELVEKDYGSEEIIADLTELKERVNEIGGIIGDYASEEGTISERLDAIEEKIAEMAKNHDFADIDNDGEWEPGTEEEIGDDSIIINGKPW